MKIRKSIFILSIVIIFIFSYFNSIVYSKELTGIKKNREYSYEKCNEFELSGDNNEIQKKKIAKK